MKALLAGGFLVMLCTSFFSASPVVSTTNIQTYSVVHYDQNVMSNVENLQKFYALIDQFVAGKKDKIIITHFGDSHIQADFLTHETRTQLQRTFGNGGRGFVFPFRMVRTNGPLNVGIQYGGEWQSCRSLLQTDNCNYGLGGVTASTFDSAAFVRLNPNSLGNLNNEFNRLKLFYLQSPHTFDPQFLTADSSPVSFDLQPIGETVSEAFFEKMQDSLWLTFNKREQQNHFQLYGMSFENSNRGVVYHAVGQNGANVKTFLRQAYFEEQLKSLDSDLVIISLGTNDGYMSESMFCKSCFKDNYRELILKVLKSTPNSAIILVTPGDYYVRKKYHNNNIAQINEAIYELSKEYKTAVWDFNRVMGGDKSIIAWRDAGLARSDLVHFSEEGYVLQGNLLYQAIMEGYESRFD